MKVDKETGEILDDEFEAMVEAIDVDTIEKLIEHPCEELFGIEPGTTIIEVPAPRNTNLVEVPVYDSKDKEIEENFQEIYDKSMDAFDGSQMDMEGIEGKYKARNSEVAVQMLNTALSAAKEKASLKQHKDKLSPGSMGDNSTVNNTQINVSTSDLVKMLAEEQDPTNNNVKVGAVTVEQDDKPRRNTIKRKKNHNRHK